MGVQWPPEVGTGNTRPQELQVSAQWSQQQGLSRHVISANKGELNCTCERDLNLKVYAIIGVLTSFLVPASKSRVAEKMLNVICTQCSYYATVKETGDI